MPQMLGDFLKPIQTISFAELAEALGCNESTLYIAGLKMKLLNYQNQFKLVKKDVFYL